MRPTSVRRRKNRRLLLPLGLELYPDVARMSLQWILPHGQRHAGCSLWARRVLYRACQSLENWRWGLLYTSPPGFAITSALHVDCASKERSERDFLPRSLNLYAYEMRAKHGRRCMRLRTERQERPLGVSCCIWCILHIVKTITGSLLGPKVIIRPS
jgi:hypothetical protein